MLYVTICFQLCWRNFSEKPQPIAYEISENKSFNQPVCKYIITTTFTFPQCPKMLLQIMLDFSNENLFKNMIGVLWKLNFFPFKEEYYMDNHLKCSIILIFAAQQKWQVFCPNLLPRADFQTSLQKTVDK